MIRLALAMLGFSLLLAACAGDRNRPLGLPENATACPAEKPQMCTMDYRPAYGYDAEGGIVGDFGNACGACAEEGVEYTSPKPMTPPADNQ